MSEEPNRFSVLNYLSLPFVERCNLMAKFPVKSKDSNGNVTYYKLDSPLNNLPYSSGIDQTDKVEFLKDL